MPSSFCCESVSQSCEIVSQSCCESVSHAANLCTPAANLCILRVLNPDSSQNDNQNGPPYCVRFRWIKEREIERDRENRIQGNFYESNGYDDTARIYHYCGNNNMFAQYEDDHHKGPHVENVIEKQTSRGDSRKRKESDIYGIIYCDI